MRLKMVELSRIELLTSCVQGRRSPSWAIAPSRCRYCMPISWEGNWWVWVDSNHRPLAYQANALTTWATDPVSSLSYKPYQSVWTLIVTHLSSLFKSESKLSVSYKEVIQRQVPLALPCYDFTPVMNHKVVSVLPKVKLPTSFAAHSHGVTGGVYKARERIHRGILIHDY